MKQFSDCAQYNHIVKSFRATHKKLVTNNYLMFGEVEKLISENRLFYEIFPNTLLIFRDEIAYWNVSFLSERELAAVKLKTDKPCVTEIVSKGSSLSERNQALKCVVEAFGFQYSCLNRYYEFHLDSQEMLHTRLNELTGKLEESHLSCIPFVDSYLNEVHALWESVLNRNNIPKEDWLEHIRNSFLVVDEKSNNVLCGVYMPKTDGNKFTTWHLAVNPSYRNKKIAYFLTLCMMKKAVEEGYDKMYNWIADENIPSLRLHQQFGMQVTENVSYQYTL